MKEPSIRLKNWKRLKDSILQWAWLAGGAPKGTPNEMNSEKPASPSVVVPLTIPMSEVNPSTIPDGATVLYESRMPSSCVIGNLVYERKYQEAIELGEKLLADNPHDCGIHINLMDAYFKARALSPGYIDKCNHHAKQAMLYGHNTGHAQDRLAKNLDKAKAFHQSLQLYTLILDTEGFHFSCQGIGNTIDFARRRDSVLRKMDKAEDRETDILFTAEEIALIVKNIEGMFYKFWFMFHSGHPFSPAALSSFLASCWFSLGHDARITPSFVPAICSKKPDKSARQNL